MDMDKTNPEKLAAAKSAVELVKDGMVVGLGSGSTAEIAIRVIGEKVKHGLRIVGVATSEHSEHLAKSLGISVATLADHPEMDLAIDGADEVELGSLNLIKGLGGALLREKIVASSARKFVIVADESKLVHQLGEHGKVPVEIVPFGWESTVKRLEKIGWKPVLRKDGQGKAFVTDGGHYTVDCSFAKGTVLPAKAAELHGTVGVVEHGIFLGMASEVHVGNATGARVLRK